MFFDSKELDKTVYTSQSADIVAHEMGHAVLDGLRPNYIASWNSEGRAFHEAFADIAAKLVNMSYESNIDAIIEETNGDLYTDNRLSRMGEEFGHAIKLMDRDPDNDHETFLRNSNNNFRYVEPSNLPNSGGRDILTSSPHSFSRIFSGAFYDIIVEMSNEKASESGDLKQALKDTRDTMGPLFAKSVDLCPPSDVKFKHVAESMLKADEVINQGENRELLSKIFIDRNILTDDDIKRNDLPSIELDRKIDTDEDALKFLAEKQDELGIDAGEFTEAQVDTDKYGNTIIQYGQTMEVEIKDRSITRSIGLRKEVYTDVHGGMTIAFDKDGKLFSRTVDEIDDKKIDNTIAGIKDAANKKLVKAQPAYKSSDYFKSRAVPYEAEVLQDPEGKVKIQKIPISFD
jgi:Zn-dependent metalloprotease